MLGLIATLVVIRIVITFDVNQWQKDRREANARKDAEKVVTQCGHVWTLYPHSEFSQCNMCLALIKTSTLLFAKTQMDPKPIIVATRIGITIKPGSGIVVASYVGGRQV